MAGGPVVEPLGLLLPDAIGRRAARRPVRRWLAKRSVEVLRSSLRPRTGARAEPRAPCWRLAWTAGKARCGACCRAAADLVRGRSARAAARLKRTAAARAGRRLPGGADPMELRRARVRPTMSTPSSPAGRTPAGVRRLVRHRLRRPASRRTRGVALGGAPRPTEPEFTGTAGALFGRRCPCPDAWPARKSPLGALLSHRLGCMTPSRNRTT